MNNKIQKGEIITDFDNKKYYIYDVTEYNKKNYAICIGYNKEQSISVFEYRFVNSDLEIKKENNIKIVQKVLTNIL